MEVDDRKLSAEIVTNVETLFNKMKHGQAMTKDEYEQMLIAQVS
jgi:hypothetical protein